MAWPEARTRLAALLSSRDALRLARWWVPAGFGLYALWLGADSNWDLYNYHLYNPFAWLHGKLAIDLAPAGFQSYFNPLLDLPLFWANQHLPPALVGAALGTAHGLTFVLVLEIARVVFAKRSAAERIRLPLLLAAAGCLTANFLSCLGNSMGDDSTALLILSGFWVLLSDAQALPRAGRRAALLALLSGLLVGLGTGLKLTNAIYCVALFITVIASRLPWRQRLMRALSLALGVMMGIALTGGYWMWHMWQQFGNPLYPQYSRWFTSPLTRAVSAVDAARWQPRGWLETLSWPVLISLDARRAGENPLHQVIWAVVYGLAVICLLVWLVGRARRTLSAARAPLASAAAQPPGLAQAGGAAQMVMVFVSVGFVVWMKVFGVYRYLVAIEVLAPMMVLLLLERLLPERHAQRVALWVLTGCTLVVLAGGAKTWGHEGWAKPLVHAQLPVLDAPERTVAVLFSRASAWAWLATLFPPQVAFTQIGGPFPGSALFEARRFALIEARLGEAYGLIDGAEDARAESLVHTNQLLRDWGITRSVAGCSALALTMRLVPSYALWQALPTGAQHCALQQLPSQRIDLAAQNLSLAQAAAQEYLRAGLILEIPTCVPYRAGIGTGIRVYQWCKLGLARQTLQPAGTAEQLQR